MEKDIRCREGNVIFGRDDLERLNQTDIQAVESMQKVFCKNSATCQNGVCGARETSPLKIKDEVSKETRRLGARLLGFGQKSRKP